ncbi:Cytochrome c-type biogenesis protein CcsB [Frankia canadensis]|uniref:Cytochrome c-type biogenesis protein CcsB n=1 Tax=Frankia canadensis TaxID=1836972 RepID=A0A2I2KJM3_9ACTN|nr:c-type cytochrome biogenesis protein CcsB [Frankia canadensis]SNQ45871.1 Cytochrome c-type biogenesis protein CcsB [Frankia canadensis]SOU53161.1 Cytochrome c-type biogenesis protein CcsB [Frankia canadensis]
MAVNEGVSSLSDHLFGSGMAVYAAAMLGYAAEFAFSRLGTRGAAAQATDADAAAAEVPAARVGADQPAVLVGVGGAAASEALGGDAVADPDASALAAARAREIEAVRQRDRAAHSLAGGNDGDVQVPVRARWVGRVAVILTVLGWALHLSSVVTRGIAADRVPWGNMYEYSSMICLIAVTTFLGLLTRHNVRWLGVFVMVPVVLYLGFAGTVLYVAPGPLVPALNSYWLKIHVVGAIVSSGVFLVSAVTTLLFLLKERWENRLAEVAAGRAEASRAMQNRGGIVMRLPSSAALDALTYRVIAFAFPIWTFAIIAGAIWAEAAWGRYWGWDPKETWSFITWVCYAAYLHARATAGWRGRRAAAISLVAFTALFVDYYLVNLVITGLHSYAGV